MAVGWDGIQAELLFQGLSDFHFSRTSACVGSNICGTQEDLDFSIFESSMNWNDFCREMWSCLSQGWPTYLLYQLHRCVCI